VGYAIELKTGMDHTQIVGHVFEKVKEILGYLNRELNDNKLNN
jgi:hypothetical protein